MPGRRENSAGARWGVSKFSLKFFLLIPLASWLYTLKCPKYKYEKKNLNIIILDYFGPRHFFKGGVINAN